MYAEFTSPLLLVFPVLVKALARLLAENRTTTDATAAMNRHAFEKPTHLTVTMVAGNTSRQGTELRQSAHVYSLPKLLAGNTLTR